MSTRADETAPATGAETDPAEQATTAVEGTGDAATEKVPAGTDVGAGDAGAADVEAPDVEAAGAEGAAAEAAEVDGAAGGAAETGAAAAERVSWQDRLLGRGTRRIVTLAVVAVLLLGAIGSLAWWRLTALPDGAALEADGVVVSSGELDHRVQTLRALYGVEPPADPPAHDRFLRDAAKSVALSTVLDKAATDRQIVIADKEADDVLNRFVVQAYGPGGRDAFVRALGTAGTSEPAVLDEIKRQLAVSRLTDQVVGDVTVGDDELRGLFDQRRGELATPEKRALRHIVVGSEQDARSVLDALRAGTPFEALAAQKSLDASTKGNGGSLGAASRDQLDPAFADAAFAGKAGAPFGPVQTANGWHVGRVDSVTAPVPAQFEQVKEPFRQKVQAERATERWRGWLAGALHDADVRYADQFRPADPDALPAATAAPAPR